MPSARRLVVGAVLLNDVERPTAILAARRIGSMAGHWEFPGGKVEAGETTVEAVKRELREELSVDIEVFDRLVPKGGPSRWPISEGMEMELWTSHIVAGEVTVGVAHDEVVWVGHNNISALRWLPADIAVIDLIKREVLVKPRH